MLNLKNFSSSENRFLIPYLGNVSYRKNFSGWYKGKVTLCGRHEFYLITRGRGKITVGEWEYEVAERDLIYIPADEGIRYDLSSDEDLIDYYSINITCAVGTHVSEIWLYDEVRKYHYQTVPYQDSDEWSFSRNEGSFDLPTVRTMHNYTILQDLLAKIHHIRNDGETADFWVEKNLLQRFLCEVSKQNQVSHQEDMNSLRLRRLTAYIKNHYMEPVTLEDLCEVVNLSPGYLIRLFKKHTALSPMAYVNLIRIEISKEMLSESTLSIAEIALLAGIQDPFYFSKKFKQITGITPRQYRNNLP